MDPNNIGNILDNLQQQLQALQTQVNQQNATIVQQNQTIADQNNQIAAQVPQPAPGPAPVPRIKPERPPPFTGRKNESLEAWIFQMEQYCQLAPVPENDCIMFVATFLKDQAALWWRSYHQGQNW